MTGEKCGGQPSTVEGGRLKTRSSRTAKNALTERNLLHVGDGAGSNPAPRTTDSDVEGRTLLPKSVHGKTLKDFPETPVCSTDKDRLRHFAEIINWKFSFKKSTEKLLQKVREHPRDFMREMQEKYPKEDSFTACAIREILGE